MPDRRPLLLAPLLALLPLAAGAEDKDQIRDLRLQLGLGPSRAETDFTFSALGGSASSSDEEDADRAGQFGIGYTAAIQRLAEGPGLIWSVGLTGTNHEVELDAGEERRFSSLAVEAGLGLGIPLGSGFHLEAAPFLALGGATGEIEFGNGADVDGEAFYWAIGARAAGFFTFGNGLQLGLELRYTHSGAEFQDEDTVLGVEIESEIDVTISGLGVLACLGYRF